jgi:hypothetical protein
VKPGLSVSQERSCVEVVPAEALGEEALGEDASSFK